ncbi:O-antigen ligase family protein [Kineococcus glutinatus]|uniref:O-antigen ligase-related domain-containing protein n=1 Tax=Kineococcus glutinatus TaxID=1070872 RepID=A0ABP8VDF1_9ACTN
MEVLLAAAAALAGLVFCVTASDRTRLATAAFLAVPQVFAGPLGALSLPLSQCWVILMAVCWLVERKGVPLGDPVMRAVFLFAAVNGAAIAWSPDPMVGILEVARITSFAFLYLYAVRVEREDPRGVRGVLRVVLAWALVAAALVWAFRLSPAAETAFLRSPLASLVAGPDAMAAFWGESANNVTDPAKAGGFFINANVASMFLGVATFACLLLLAEERRRRHVAAALVIWSATFATGSKTAAALALLLPVAVRGVHVLGRPTARWFLPQALLFAGAVLWLLPDLLARFVPSYAEASAHSLDSRAPMWEAAVQMFKQHWALGLGHGGWARTMELYAQFGIEVLPPHNLFIAAWAATGLAGVAALAAFALVVLHLLVTTVLRATGSPLGRTAAFALGAWVWVLVHGMGDNTAVYGEAKSMTLLALVLGVVTARRSAVAAAAATAPTTAPTSSAGRSPTRTRRTATT